MKKVLICSLLLLAGILAWGGNSDLVVLLDTSESMFGEFDSTVTYLIRDIIKNNVSIDWDFHLILFDSYTNVDYKQKIEKPEDASAIINHLALVQPFGKYTDLIEAFQTLLSYCGDLPEQNEKNIVILTDGIHDPPPGKYSTDGKEEIRKLTEQLSDSGWNINIVPLNGDQPGNNLHPDDAGEYFTTEDGGKPASAAGNGEKTGTEILSEQLDADIIDPNSIEGQMILTGGIHLQPRKTSFKSKNQKLKLRFKAENYNTKDIEITVLDVIHNKSNILQEPVSFSVPAKESASFNLNVDFYGALLSSNTEYPVKLTVRADAPVAPLVYDLEIKYREFSFTLDVLPVIIIILVAIAAIIIITGLLRTRARVNSGVRDEEDQYKSASARFKKKDKKGRQAIAQERKYPYEGDDKSKVKGTVYYPDSKKSGKPAATADRTVVAADSRSDKAGKSGSAADAKSTPNIGGKKQEDQKQGKDNRDAAAVLGYALSPESHQQQKYRTRSRTRNVKYLLMLNVNVPFNPIMAGTRVQRLDKGKTLTVGSGNSSFYLYFSKILPGPIASVCFSGDRCSFIPHDFKYFPDLKAPLDDCINKKIRVTNGKEEQTITFKEWLSPLEEINRIMHLIDYRGLPKSPFDDEE